MKKQIHEYKRRCDAIRFGNPEDRNEFPTPREVVLDMIAGYGGYLRGMKVHCPCDDGSKSEFYKILKQKYSELGLAGLVATGYVKNGNGV